MHNIEYYDYKENANKKQIWADLNDYVEHQTWAEGGSGLEPIRWNDYICVSYEEAKKWIEDHDRGWYDQIAVKYLAPVSCRNAKTEELDKKIAETYEVFKMRNNVCYPKTRTSEYIGCSHCKSRLATKFLKGNFCPVCNADLRPETMLKTIAAAKAKWENAQKNMREYINKHSKKEVRWLVKIEYHT